jgi:hypothetical protein
LHWKPREYLELDNKEKAFLIASIQKRIESEKKEADKANKAKRRRK